MYINQLKKVLSNVFLCVPWKSLSTRFVVGSIIGKLTLSSLIWYQISWHFIIWISLNQSKQIKVHQIIALFWEPQINRVITWCVNGIDTNIISSVSVVKWCVLNPTDAGCSMPNMGLWFFQECRSEQVFNVQRYVFVNCSTAKQLLPINLVSN